jgi:hypothetical protein
MKSWQGEEIVPFSPMSTLALEPMAFLFGGYWGSLSTGVEQLEHEAYQLFHLVLD